MNIWFLLASLLSFISAAAHGIGGEITILRKIPATAFPEMPNGDGAQAKAETRMTWHSATAYFALAGVVLLLLATGQIVEGTSLAWLIAGTYAAWTLVLALVPALTLRDPRAALRSPQWVLLLLLTGLTLGGILG